LSGIREVAGGKNYVSPSLAPLVMDDYVRRAKGTRTLTDADKLTMREREVLQLISEGKSSAEIGDRLCISVRTVESHRQKIMDKLAIHSVAGLTRFAIRHGITALH
jgi:DNA-binding NarL/FixJ family response regulator